MPNGTPGISTRTYIREALIHPLDFIVDFKQWKARVVRKYSPKQTMNASTGTETSTINNPPELQKRKTEQATTTQTTINPQQSEKKRTPITSDISFEAPVTRNTEDTIKDLYTELLDSASEFTKSKEASTILVNALLVKKYGLNPDDQKSGGAQPGKTNHKADYSHIDIILPEEKEVDKQKSKSFERFKTAHTEIKQMLKKHKTGESQRAGGSHSPYSNIFTQMMDHTSENFSQKKVEEIKKQYKEALASSNQKTENEHKGFSITQQWVKPSENDEKLETIDEFHQWCYDRLSDCPELSDFLVKSLLVIEGAAEWEKNGDQINFNKIHITADQNKIKSAVTKGKHRIKDHLNNLSKLKSSSHNTHQVISEHSPKHIIDSLEKEITPDNTRFDHKTKEMFMERYYSLLNKSLPDIDLSQDQINQRISSASNIKKDSFNDIKASSTEEAEKIKQKLEASEVNIIGKRDKAVAFEITEENSVNSKRKEEIQQRIKSDSDRAFEKKLNRFSELYPEHRKQLLTVIDMILSHPDCKEWQDPELDTKLNLTRTDILNEYTKNVFDKEQNPIGRIKPNAKIRAANTIVHSLAKLEPFETKPLTPAEMENRRQELIEKSKARKAAITSSKTKSKSSKHRAAPSYTKMPAPPQKKTSAVPSNQKTKKKEAAPLKQSKTIKSEQPVKTTPTTIDKEYTPENIIEVLKLLAAGEATIDKSDEDKALVSLINLARTGQGHKVSEIISEAEKLKTSTRDHEAANQLDRIAKRIKELTKGISGNTTAQHLEPRYQKQIKSK